MSAVATADSTANSVGLPPAQKIVTEAPSLRLRTRLNGSHEWKWRVAMDDTFAKVHKLTMQSLLQSFPSFLLMLSYIYDAYGKLTGASEVY